MHQYLGIVMLKKGIPTFLPALILPTDGTSFLYKAMPLLLAHAMSVTPQENLEVQFKILMFALNNVSVSSMTITRMALEGDG